MAIRFTLLSSLLAIAAVPTTTNDSLLEALMSPVARIVESTTTNDPLLEALTPTVAQIVESKAVTTNDAKFVVVADGDWALYPSAFGVKVELQLMISNRGKKTAIFPTFDTYRVNMKGPDGKKLWPGGGRDWSDFTRPIQLSPGSSFALTGKATFRRFKNLDGCYFLFEDDTGSATTYGPLEPGTYKLWFSYDSTQDPPSLPKMLRRGDVINGVPIWSGRVETGSVDIVVSERKTPVQAK